jgi:serine/threonine protein phosphatase PrpC
MYRIYNKTHPGAVRDHNEDAFVADAHNGLVAVIDGMGGHAAGDVASGIVAATLAELNPDPDRLVAALMECHGRILAHAEAHPESRGMGATVVVAKLSPERVTVCWAGDCRAYLVNRQTGLKPLSRDHSYVQWLLLRGEISAEQAQDHPERNVVTQCLGIHPPQPERTLVPWAAGDRLLLCSDGLTSELDDATIAGVLVTAESSAVALERLVDAALSAGGRDNITLVLVEHPVAPAPIQAAEARAVAVRSCNSIRWSKLLAAGVLIGLMMMALFIAHLQ